MSLRIPQKRDKDFQKRWSAERARGMWSFVFRRGLFASILAFILTELLNLTLDGYPSHGYSTSRFWIKALFMISFMGVFFGLSMWAVTEHSYRKTQSSIDETK